MTSPHSSAASSPLVVLKDGEKYGDEIHSSASRYKVASPRPRHDPVWQPPSEVRRWVRETTMGGDAMRIRRDQDLAAGVGSLGARPRPSKKRATGAQAARAAAARVSRGGPASSSDDDSSSDEDVPLNQRAIPSGGRRRQRLHAPTGSLAMVASTSRAPARSTPAGHATQAVPGSGGPDPLPPASREAFSTGGERCTAIVTFHPPPSGALHAAAGADPAPAQISTQPVLPPPASLVPVGTLATVPSEAGPSGTLPPEPSPEWTEPVVSSRTRAGARLASCPKVNNRSCTTTTTHTTVDLPPVIQEPGSAAQRSDPHQAMPILPDAAPSALRPRKAGVLPKGTLAPLEPRPSVGESRRRRKHYVNVPGPWACAIEAKPPPPIVSGHKRAAAGLAEDDISYEEIKRIRRVRSATDLVAILPYGCAAFALQDSDDAVRSRSDAENARRLVSHFSTFGTSSVNAAYSLLGRLLEWTSAHVAVGATMGGSDYSEFARSTGSGASVGFKTTSRWLKDWCGVDVPARTGVERQASAAAEPAAPPPSGPPPVIDDPASVGDDRESLWLDEVLALEHLCAAHANPVVRGQAAQWAFLATHFLRGEQGNGCVINAFVAHQLPHGESVLITAASAILDKNPDASKQKARPVWGVFDGFRHPGVLRREFIASLEGAEDVRCILLDSDSPDGNPASGTRFVRAPLIAKARIRTSLVELLVLAASLARALRRAGSTRASASYSTCPSALPLSLRLSSMR